MAVNLFNKIKTLFNKNLAQAPAEAEDLEFEHEICLNGAAIDRASVYGASIEGSWAEGESRKPGYSFNPSSALSNEQKGNEGDNDQEGRENFRGAVQTNILPTGYTENYGLVKPGQNDSYDIEVGNSNLDVIDELIKENGEAIEDIAGPGRTSETVVGAYAAAEAAMPAPVFVSLPASSWTVQNGLPAQTIPLPGMVPEDLVVSCLPETLTLAQAKAIGKAVLMLRNQQPGSVDVVCLGTAPAIDVPFSILWYGGGN